VLGRFAQHSDGELRHGSGVGGEERIFAKIGDCQSHGLVQGFGL
jgi:hypothetical protein